MGRGAGKLNAAAVKRIAQGTADFFLSNNRGGGCGTGFAAGKNELKATKNAVVICYDGRKNSRLFANLCALAFAHNGFTAYLPNRCAPTPYLSFAVRESGAAGGVMITASHNAKEYNGYKLYGADGCQLTDADAERVSGFIGRVKSDKGGKEELKPFSYYSKIEKIKSFDLSSQYLRAVRAQTGVSLDAVKKSGLKIVYTPFCGVGGIFAQKLFKNNPDFFTVAEQFKPDAEFASCPQPNPEKKEAYALALKYAEKHNADVILANDPDADRLGVMAKTGAGYKLLSGNQTGVLLLNYLLEETVFGGADLRTGNARPYGNTKPMNIGLRQTVGATTGRLPNGPIVIRTIVSTPLADRLIEAHGGEVITVPTGFKYIGEAIAALEQKGEEGQFLLGFEESHGYLSGTYVRDKDGLLAAALIASYAAKLKNKGQTLFDALDLIYKKHGYYAHKTLNYRFDDENKIVGIMARLRDGEGIGGLKIGRIKDYLEDRGKYKPDMLELCTADGSLIVRPSGTEPLIKVYLTVKKGYLKECEKLIGEYENTCNGFFE